MIWINTQLIAPPARMSYRYTNRTDESPFPAMVDKLSVSCDWVGLTAGEAHAVLKDMVGVFTLTVYDPRQAKLRSMQAILTACSLPVLSVDVTQTPRFEKLQVTLQEQ